MNRKVISFIVIAIAAVLMIYVLASYDYKKVGTQVGNIAPDFTSPVMNAEAETGSLSDYKGNIIILNFWGTFCEPCQREMPELVKFYNDYHDQGIQVIGVNMTKYEPIRKSEKEIKVKEFLEKYEATYPNFYNHNDEFYKTYQAKVLPTTYIIDEDLEIQRILLGEVNYKMLKEIVLPLVEE